MSILKSIGSDFVEKRLWPVAALLGGLLVAVLAYVALSGGGKAAPTTPVAGAPAVTGPTVTPAPANPNVAVSETTTGARYQRQAGAHHPLVALGGGSARRSSSA